MREPANRIIGLRLAIERNEKLLEFATSSRQASIASSTIRSFSPAAQPIHVKSPRHRLLAFQRWLLPGLCLLALASCRTISLFDQAAYENAVSAKVDTLVLMGKATGSYSAHQKEIEAVKRELEKAYEYDLGRPLNKITAAQWQILLDPNRDLVGGFLKMWKNNDSLGATFIAEKKLQIAEAFDQIIGLESGKIKPSQVKQ